MIQHLRILAGCGDTGFKEKTINRRLVKQMGLKNPAKIQAIVNWFYGNYCVRKCRQDLAKQCEHWGKLQQLAAKMNGTTMTHKDFLNMIRSDRSICNLSDEEWNKRVKIENNCAICKRFGLKL